MNICLYGASSDTIDKLYIEKTEMLGKEMGKRGHTLIFGGGARGLMGAAARGITKAGGKAIGIAPSFFNVDGVLFPMCAEFIYTKTMRERKQILEEKSDAFIATPGGIGTFDELFEIATLKQLGQHNKPVVLFNINGYFDNLLKMLDDAVKGEFMTDGARSIFKSFSDEKELIDFLENYKAEDFEFSVMKKVSQ